MGRSKHDAKPDLRAIARDLPPDVEVTHGRCSICPRGYDVVMPIVRVTHPDALPEKGKKPWFGFCSRCIDLLATEGRKVLEGR